MKRLLPLIAVFAALSARGDFDYEEPPYEFDRFYVGVAGAGVLPQGGSRLDSRAGIAMRFGCYLAEMWAVEGEATWLDDRAGLGLKALWHWWGYERLDPFFTFGARGWVNDGQVGPCGGLGAFYHLTESLSLRFDADATIGVETRTEMVYSLSAGFQWSF